MGKKYTVKNLNENELKKITGGSWNGAFQGALDGAGVGLNACKAGGPKVALACGAGGILIGGSLGAYFD